MLPLFTPFGNDDHWEVVTFLRDHGRIPFSDELGQAYHPPLYYVLMWPFSLLDGPRLAQAATVALSCANLALLYRFVRDTPLLRTPRARLHALLLAAILPQFVMYGSVISNDGLAFLVGTAAILLALRYLDEPAPGRLGALGAGVGAGLLTKGTFLGFLPAGAAVAALGGWRRGTVRRGLAAAALFGLVAGGVGSWKFVQNQARLGRPIVHNMELEPHWLAEQQGVWRGPSSLVDLDVTRLVRDPGRWKAVRHSIPLLLYGSTWYPLTRESRWWLTRGPPWDHVARALNVAGLVPTLLVLGGLGLLAWRCRELARAPQLPAARYRARAHAFALLAFAAGTLAVVLAAGLRFDAWSSFHGRLLFPAMAAGCAGLGTALDRLPRRARAPAAGLLWASWATCALYLVVEGAAAVARMPEG